MKATLHKINLRNKTVSINITGSKSESNRLLILEALYPNISIKNLSQSDDTQVLQYALETNQDLIDIHHAGTAMRFLTAYFATIENSEIILTGSERMQERPIGILVDALNNLGAQIEYLKNEGYPPLKINGKNFSKNEVTIAASTSSQYITALLLIAPSLPNGLTINLKGEITSIPYVKMTLSLLNQLGINHSFSDNKIQIHYKENIDSKRIVVESDWSSASYFYSIVALSQGIEITLKSYKKESLQGDSALIKLYQKLGVQTEFIESQNAIKLSKSNVPASDTIQFNLIDTPDIAQTIAVTCFGLGVSCELNGLHTLKIKETDRINALKIELEKLGASVQATQNSLSVLPTKNIKENVVIDTYNDHRMALAFAPLALKTKLQINDCKVVSKSFPTFWNDLKTLGFLIDLQ